MDVLMLTLFASLLLVAAALLFVYFNLRQGSHEHTDRLALLPLADDDKEPDEHDAHHVR